MPAPLFLAGLPSDGSIGGYIKSPREFFFYIRFVMRKLMCHAYLMQIKYGFEKLKCELVKLFGCCANLLILFVNIAFTLFYIKGFSSVFYFCEKFLLLQ